MRRLLVVDDERPVVEAISLIVRRDLAGEFEVAGAASSGREALEQAARLSPDIVLMDVRMPGISGLEAVRELRRRGSEAAFILVTAYERFDIAREAVEIGVLDYLLKPVSKDKLALSLRAAAAFLDRRGELERRELEHREREERMRASLEAAFLHGIVLGEEFGPELERHRAGLGLAEPLALAAAASFLPGPAAPDPAAAARALHEAFRRELRYKTRALVGPLLGGLALVLLPLRAEAEAEEAVAGLLAIRARPAEGPAAGGRIELGLGPPLPLAEAGRSWNLALAALLGPPGGPAGLPEGPAGLPEGPAGLPEGRPFRLEEELLEGLLEGRPEGAWAALEAFLLGLPREGPAPRRELYRLIALFGQAARLLAGRGQLEEAEALAMQDLEDLRAASGGLALALAARSRLARLLGAARRGPRPSAPVAAAMALVAEAYGRPIGLEAAAERAGLSPQRLSRLFVEETGRGFSDYLIEYRVERAKELLSGPEPSIKQVSMACGYPDPNYFSRLFKKVTGRTPTDFAAGKREAP